MPLGKEIGEYSTKITSIRIVEVDGDQRVIEATYEGEVTGQISGTITGTQTFTGTNDRGSIDDKSVGYMSTGESITSQGSGVYWLTKPGQWETRIGVSLSSGQNIVGEGTIELETRSETGKVFELE